MAYKDSGNIIFKILKYYYVDDLSQAEIASKLNISRVAVSRYISRAKGEGLIEHKINYPKNFSFERNEELEKEFIKKYGLKECIIVSSKASLTETLIELSNELEKLFGKIIRDHTIIGVGWGTTLDKIIEYIDIRKKKNVKVLPLVGGYGRVFDNIHSNNIARILAKKFNGISYMVHIPAILDTKEIKESILKDSAAKEIYRLAKRVEVALLCMSDLSKESTLYKKKQLDEEDIYYLKGLEVIGDINFVFLDREGNFVPNEISDRQAMLFPTEQMKTTNYVVGVAIGERKVEIIRAVLKGKLINILMTDEETAKLVTDKETAKLVTDKETTKLVTG